jgi:hypothetical protein
VDNVINKGFTVFLMLLFLEKTLYRTIINVIRRHELYRMFHWMFNSLFQDFSSAAGEALSRKPDLPDAYYSVWQWSQSSLTLKSSIAPPLLLWILSGIEGWAPSSFYLHSGTHSYKALQ